MNTKLDDNQPLTEIDQAWINLAQQRAAEIRAGTAQTFPADQVIDETRQACNRQRVSQVSLAAGSVA